jgi:uncharacterized protein YcbK (DUF882 family)
MTHLTQHFTLAELTRTSTGIDNTCPAELLPDLLDTAAMMERIRAALCAHAGKDVAIHVSSGYRSPAVNRAVGGSASSDHMAAQAVDFTAPDFGTPFEVAEFLSHHTADLGIGQLIHEFGDWVHVSRKRPERAVNEVITYAMAQGRRVVHLGIVEVA